MPNTREKLIELMKDVPCHAKTCLDCEFFNTDGCGSRQREILADHLIANGVRLEEKQATSDETSKWIPVTERLPDTAERVLVSKHWLGMQYKPEYGYYQDFPNQKGCWYVLTEFGYYPQREITHWMPLPEPPKE